MGNLQLSLKRNWFEMTKSGVKTEDYRELTPYWCSRLLLYGGEKRSSDYWLTRVNFSNVNISISGYISSARFENNIMTLGYPKSTDSERILKLEHKGIEIREGNPDWGAEVGKLYIVIKHGKML